MGKNVIPHFFKFKYPGSILQNEVEINEDATHRINAGWLKWRKASGIICDYKVPTKHKGKFFHSTIHLAILHGNKCWCLQGQEKRSK